MDEAAILERMSSNLAYDIQQASMAAFTDSGIPSRQDLRPSIIDNAPYDATLGDTIGNALRKCSTFLFSVAFISQSGLEAILQALAEARDNGARGRIITTDYLTFSEPAALKRLQSFSSFIETRVVTGEGFHTKGYCFRSEESTTIIIGSSNLTQTALKTNHEWNVAVTTLEEGQYAKDFTAAFTRLWDRAVPLSDSWLADYSKRYEAYHRALRNIDIQQEHIETYITKPNAMQEKAAEALKHLRQQGAHKALIIAATGTGKTFLSCFDVKAYNPRKMLFLVHREQILRSAAESFEKILGASIRKDIGFITGSRKDYGKKYIFSTVQTLSRESIHKVLPPDCFDYIIIDEAHRSEAGSYRRIMDYFHPDFLLGMSATPDRADGGNIYELFDYSIACDIRLKEAMENDLLCPFHYFGISDITVNGQPLDEDSSFSDLVSEERVRNIIEKARFYGWSGDRVKGLIFCRSVEEAEELSRLMNQHGLKTMAVSGSTPMAERLSYTDRLQQEKTDGSELDYLLSVDVFNEGVDIPKVNQIIMLRPTESAIVFTQQLGRGLRKDREKDFVVVIDFIANYKRSYLIPIALSGDTSYDKDTLRRKSLEGTRIIPGCSTISFDPISRDSIYRKIDEADFSGRAFLKEQYRSLKAKLGRIPTIADFRDDDTIDIQRFVDEFGSYHSFLKYAEPSFHSMLSPKEERMLTYVSRSFSDGKRKEELEFIMEALKKGCHAAESSLEYIPGKGNPLLRESVLDNLSGSFAQPSDQKKRYKDCSITDRTTGRITESFRAMIEDEDFRREMKDIISDGLCRFEERYSRRYKDTLFTLFEKYTYEDICRLLLWKQNLNALAIGGYKYDERTRTMPVFINYEKDPDAIKYEDRFLSPSEVIAFSKKPRSVDSPDADHIYKRTEKDRDNRIFLFVRKNKEDRRKEFYFLGEIHAAGDPEPVMVGDQNAFRIHYVLDTPVRNDIYDYLTSSI